MYTRRIISKVPGNIPGESQKEKQGYIGELSSKTIPQLNDLLERQLKLLANRSFINKLADKGEKITRLKEAIEEELRKRNENDNLSRMLSALSMNGKEELDALEWTGRCAPGHVTQQEDSNISDDEQDPLKILATHSGTSFHKKQIKVVKPEEPLIKPSDITVDDDINYVETGEVLEEYAKHLCQKLDSVKATGNKQAKFLPYKTLKQSVSEKKEPKVVGAHWEVTAATPPLPVHGDTKLVSLQDSIRLQSDQQQRLKEIQMKHATERLSSWYHSSPSQLPQNPGCYRDPGSHSSSDDEQSEHEVHDDEYPDGGGVVIYNLVDDTNND